MRAETRFLRLGSETSPTRRRDGVIALLLAAVAAAFRLPRLGTPAQEVFDEVYHAPSALQYLRGEPPTEWMHPPTAKLLIAVGIRLFGYHPWAWRLAPVVAGIVLAPVFFLLARRVLATERAAVLAAVLFLCDGVYLVQSRLAMTNIFAVLFQTTAVLFLLRAALPETLHIPSLLLCGLALGAALSSRWTSFFAAALIVVVCAALRGRRLLQAREVVASVIALALVPACVYAASYVPWMSQGHSLGDVVRLQGQMWRYHADLEQEHPYFTPWYAWPWLGRPALYYVEQEPPLSGPVRRIVAYGNPVLWRLSVPVTLWAIVTGLRAGDRRRVFCGLGFYALYLPWALSPRTHTFSHYLFEAIPYACLSLGALLDRLWDGPYSGPVVHGYLALAAIVFLFLYPQLTAWPLPAALFQR